MTVTVTQGLIRQQLAGSETRSALVRERETAQVWGVFGEEEAE